MRWRKGMREASSVIELSMVGRGPRWVAGMRGEVAARHQREGGRDYGQGI